MDNTETMEGRTALKIPVSLFAHKKDNAAQMRELNESQLTEALTTHDIREEKDGALWSPAIYEAVLKRGNKNVVAISCLVLDIDDGDSYADFARSWDEFFHIVYSTHTNSPQQPKWRAVFPLATPAPAAHWPNIYAQLTRRLGAGRVKDESCKDAARIYYLPSCPQAMSTAAFAFAIEGDHLAWSDADCEPLEEYVLREVERVMLPVGGEYNAYVDKARSNEFARLQSAPAGERNVQLNKTAFALGTLIGAGALARESVEVDLKAAAYAIGLNGQETANTIRSGLAAGMAKPRRLPHSNPAPIIRGRAVRAYIRKIDEPTLAAIEELAETQNDDEDDENAEPDEDEKAVNNGVYGVLNGRTVLAVQKTKGKETGSDESTSRHFVCDWAAEAIGEVRDEEGQTIFDIEGVTRNGRKFAMSLPAAKCSDARFVAGEFLNVVGVSPVLYAGMEKHVVPSIRSFSNWKTAKRIRRFNRVGWTRESEKDLRKREFIMPGMLPPDVDVTGLDNHLAYRIDPPQNDALSPEAAEALQALINAQEPKHTLIALATALVAPLSLLCNWQGDKYAIFIAGRTGSFKTSFCQLLMCLYGDFEREDTLIKFGLGTTANSLQAILTRASYMPVLIDNYKTNTGKGGNDAVSMIQAALEGGEKIRLNRNSEIRQTKPINAWLFLTGEDYVEDAASRARTLNLPFAYFGDTNESLSRAQELATALPQIGGHLLAWALTDQALIVADYAKSRFNARRSHWAKFIREHNKDAVNAYRVASSLAVCECGWEMILGCPVLAPHLKTHDATFRAGIAECARAMAFLTAETHEAMRYLDSLREMISSDRAYLCPRLQAPQADERRLKLGWEDDNGVYLIPGVAFEAAVKAMASQGGLNNMSKNALHKQLAQLGHLARHKKDQLTVDIRSGYESTPQTVLHLKRELFYPDAESGDESDL